ncbi:hypothetical protein AB1Y20_020518 [Prymnesium parvum]|uniref:N-acetyltransferase domain-containing protein n=1 Tax=Prymnesium parvum TaxID=97485 RepID=A0AB34JXL0_PRYPA
MLWLPPSLALLTLTPHLAAPPLHVPRAGIDARRYYTPWMGPHGLTVRSMEYSDIWPTAQLLLVAFAPPGGLNQLQNFLVGMEHVIGLTMRMADNILLVGTLPNGKLVGFVEVFTPEYLVSQSGSGYPERVRRALEPYVASLAVDLSSRSTGVGRTLMWTAEQRVREAGYTRISLEVESTNQAALGLYLKLGYSVLRRDQEALKLVGDVFFGRSERVTKFWLQKDLGETCADDAEFSTFDSI